MSKVNKTWIQDKKIALSEFEKLNNNLVKVIHTHSYFGTIIITDINPEELIYPEGWYNEHGTFRNKSNCHEESEMITSSNVCWRELLNYSCF